MFNGVPEQFHQFIASRTAPTLPLSLPLTLPLHDSPPPPPTFSSFIDPQQQQQLCHQHLQQQHQHQLYQQQSHLLHQLHQQQQQSASTVQQAVHHRQQQQQRQDEEKEDHDAQQLHERIRSVSEMVHDPWEKEEVLALLRIRSSMGHGFSDFIWGHVSRKLTELGYKRSPEKCKEKYEEMNQYCNDITTTNYSSSSSKNYNRSFSELEALFEDHHQNPKATATNTSVVDNEDEKNNVVRTSNVDDADDDDDSQGKMGLNLEENSGNETLENPSVENVVKKQSRSKKRKRREHKHELLKGLCEEIVNNIMNQQEELHKKLLQDMERKEEERVRREEIWKKKEMDRANKEIETRAKAQAIACDRETTIIEFLKKFTPGITSSSQKNQEDSSVLKSEDIIKTSSHNPTASSPSPSSIIQSSSENPKSALSSVLVVPTTPNTPKVPTSSSHVATVTNITPDPTCSNKKIPNLSHFDLVCENPNSIITTQNKNQGDVTSSSTAITTALTVSHEPGSTSNNDREENGKRWPRDEVYSLINLRCNLGNNSSNGGEDKENTKIPLWEKISQGMSELGYKRSAKKCKEKWENINKYFRKTKDTNKKRSLDSNTCPYFHQLNNLYNQGRLTLPSEAPENQSAAGNSTENRPGSPEPVVNGKDQEAGAGDDEKNNNASQVSAPLEFEY